MKTVRYSRKLRLQNFSDLVTRIIFFIQEIVAYLRYQLPFRTMCVPIALVFVVFMKNPVTYTFFGNLMIPENDFLFKTRQKFNVFGKWEARFFTRTCLHRLGSTLSRNKENKMINIHFLLDTSG